MPFYNQQQQPTNSLIGPFDTFKQARAAALDWVGEQATGGNEKAYVRIHNELNQYQAEIDISDVYYEIDQMHTNSFAASCY